MKHAAKMIRYKSKWCFLICFCIFYSQISTAQTFIIYGDKSFGGSSAEISSKILLDSENNLIIAGESSSNISGDKVDPNCDTNTQSNDLWILKTDTAFNFIFWQNAVGGSLSESQSKLHSSLNTGLTLFSSTSNSDSSCDKSNISWNPSGDFWVGMIDTTGVLMWDKTMGGLGSDDQPQMVQLANGNFIICGTSTSGVGGDKTVMNYGGSDIWCIMLDSLQNKIWDNVFGGSGNDSGANDRFDLIADANGNCIITCYTYSPISGTITDSSKGFADIWVIKIDSSGNKIWDKRFGGDGSDFPHSIIATNDNGYLIGGTTLSQIGFDISEPPFGIGYDFWIIKLDSLGNKQWDKRYGGSDQEHDVYLQQDFDGGYLIAGTTYSDSGYTISEPPYGNRDYWILKIDSLGNKKWDKRFGGSGNNEFSNFALLPDSSIVLFGHADSSLSVVKTDPGNGDYDYWLVRFKYLDNSIGLNEFNDYNNLVSVYPNPTTGQITISPKGEFKPDQFYLYDATGRQLLFNEMNEMILDIGSLQPALYFYEIHSRDGTKVYGKLLKQ
jgi:Secretion system C-terminal sorting domain